MADKKEIINLLNNIAYMLEYLGENPFKVKAFRNSANALVRVHEDVDELLKSKKLGLIKGIGKGIQSVIYEYCESGSSSLLSELRKQVPSGIEDLLKVHGLGPKKIKILNSVLGISNLGELEYACRENRLSLLKGFGETTQNKILVEIDKLKIYSKYILINKAEVYSDLLLERISKFKSISKIAVTGQFRRGMEIISELQFIILSRDKIETYIEIESNFECERKEFYLKIINGFDITVTLLPVESEEEFTEKLFSTTGSEEFLAYIKYSGSTTYKYTSEKEIFNRLNIPFIIPEMREKEYFEIKNTRLKEISDLSINQMHGLLHFHTTYSDGKNTIQEMLNYAEKEGFRFAAVCDHSKSAYYANGLNESRVLQQKQEINIISKEFKLHIYYGIEADILQNGELDYDKEFLKNFDFVIASVHSGFHMEQAEMTKRIITAVENPYTDVLAHPTGRLLLSRDPYNVNIKKVLEACASNNVAVEINANPHRLDLDWRNIYYAREKGCFFAINPDAHSTDDISFIKYGIMVGRKGGLLSKEVINYFDIAGFSNYLNRKVKRNLNL